MQYETKKGGAMGAVLACGLLLVLTGCQTTEAARSQAMIADVSEATLIAEDSPFFRAVSVEAVSGGKDDPMLLFEIRNPEFEEALRLSLANHVMLAEDDGRFAITAEFQEGERPVVGLDLTASLATRYRVVEVASGETVFDETVNSSFTANFSAAFNANKRYRLANEGVVRENIHAFIKQLIDTSKTGGPLISQNGTSPSGITIASIAVHHARGPHEAGVLR